MFKINIISLFLDKTKLYIKKIKIFLKIEKEKPIENKDNDKTDDIYPLW
tara:strand:+ start:64 stop:210 length:147 start_codon:yes stop_codon:yes gene_type:complete